MKSYLSIAQVGRDQIYHRYIENGERKVERVNMKPFIAVDSADCEGSGVRSLYDKPLQLKKFESISEYRQWKRENENMMNIHGDIRMEYMFAATRYQERPPIQWEQLHIDNLDIEVYCTEGFPEPDDAQWPISAITVHDIVKNTFLTFGWKDYDNHRDDVEYVRCEDETDLLRQYVAYWVQRDIDFLTGWNIEIFDIPYIINRIKKLLGGAWADKLSPVGKLTTRTYTDDFGKEITTYGITGINLYDYKPIYEKFCLDPRDGYSLEVVAQAELEKGKLDYKSDENRSLVELFENDFQKYIDYNIDDTALVGEIDHKRQYLRLAINMVYMSRCMFSDVLGTVAIWDAYLYNELLKRKIMAPPKKVNTKEHFPGGWVEDPDRGLHGWNMVFDIASSYPNSMISYNISPECILDYDTLPKELRDLADSIRPKYMHMGDTWLISEKIYDIEQCEAEVAPLLDKYDVCMTPFGEFFRRDRIGFIPDVVADVFAQRKGVKKEMKNHSDKSEEYAALDAEQGAYKVMMNSLYGAMSNIWFRYFDIRMAGSITSAGQTSVKGSAMFLERNIKGMKNMYTDTDSIFLNLQPFIDQRFKGKDVGFVRQHDFCMALGEQVIAPKLAEYFDRLTTAMNCTQKTLVMESEALADAWLITEKKRYTMRIVNDEGEELFNRETGELGKYKDFWNKNDRGEFKVGEVKLKTRGLSLIQSVTPQFARDKLKETVKLIFDVRDRDKVVAHFAEWKKEFMALPFEEIAMPRGIDTFNKYVINPKGAQAAVRAALVYNRKLKDTGLYKKYRYAHEGDKIRYAYLKEPNHFQSDVLAVLDRFPPEWSNDLKIDWDVQWEKCFTSQLEKIFGACGWNIDEAAVSLEDFFE